MNGYEVMAQVLAAEGVEFVAAFPMQNLIDAGAKIGIRPIICRQERAGVNIADGFTRVMNGRKFGVFTMQSGPGAENAFAGVAQAYADSVPMLHLAGGEPRDRLAVHPTFDAVINHHHVTKWAARIESAADIPLMVSRALAQMRHGRPGPVLLEMPRDVMAEDYPHSEVVYAPMTRHLSSAASEDVRDIVKALLAARNPIINAGQGVLYAEASAELVEFAELAQLPAMTTLAGKSAFPENHPLALGTGGLTRTLMVRRFLEETDFVLGVGTSFTKNTFTTPMPATAALAQVTNHGEDIGKDYPIVAAAVGDAKLVLRQLIEEYRRQDGVKARGDGNDAVARVASVRDEFEAAWEPHHRSDEVPISPYRVIRELSLAFDPAGTIITHDSGYPRDQLVPMWKSPTPRGYLAWGKSTQLGYGLGLAIGAKLAAPDKHVINLMGEAAFGMSGMDVETAVRSTIPILTVVLNNGQMTGYDGHMPNASERYHSNQLSGDYSAVAAGLGAHAERVEAPDQLAPAFARAKAANAEGRPALVEVVSKVEKQVAK
jgi:thiamine pyrophosphate-dependent acetolactate synthase large subunit-like protein